MKKLYSLVIFSALVVSAFGQARINSSVNENPVSSSILKNGNPSAMGLDTLWPPSFGMPFQCDTAAVYYNWTPATDGYVFGNNTYSATACAQKYYGTGTVDEVLAWIAYKTGTTGVTSANVYSIDGTTKKPLSVLGSSVPVTLANVVTTPFTSYTFAATVAVTNEFAVSVEFPSTQSAGDTVAVVSTKIGCATTDSLSWMNVPAFGGWLSTPSVINGNPNCELYIFPVGTLSPTTGINEYSGNGLSLLGAFPNPAKDVTNIQFRMNEASAVSINVFDLTGRVILNSTENLSEGTHEIKVSLKDVAAGKYYYTVKTAKAQLTSKFVVVK